MNKGEIPMFKRPITIRRSAWVAAAAVAAIKKSNPVKSKPAKPAGKSKPARSAESARRS